MSGVWGGPWFQMLAWLAATPTFHACMSRTHPRRGRLCGSHVRHMKRRLCGAHVRHMKRAVFPDGRGWGTGDRGWLACTCIHAYKHTHKHTYRHAGLRAHMHTHTHTHIHTHTQLLARLADEGAAAAFGTHPAPSWGPRASRCTATAPPRWA